MISSTHVQRERIVSGTCARETEMVRSLGSLTSKPILIGELHDREIIPQDNKIKQASKVIGPERSSKVKITYFLLFRGPEFSSQYLIG